jgi:integrase
MPPYKTKDKRWRFRGVVNGKHYSGSAPKGDNTKKAAEWTEQELLRKLRSRQFTGTVPTVAEFVDKFLAYQKTHTAPLTQSNQRIHLETHVVPKLGSKHLDDVHREDIDALKTDWREDGAAIRSINARLDTLQTMFTLAKEWRYLTVTPVIKRLKVPKDTPRFLTQAEATALLDAAQDQWRSMILIGLRTGLRVGELRGLQWGDVDLDRGMLQIRRTDPGRPDMPANAPKGKRERPVPLTPDARAALEAIRPGSAKPNEWVWPGLPWRGRNRNRPRSASGCFHGIRHAIDKAGIHEPEGDELAWHTLRHTFASWLVLRGVSLRIVQDLLGHASIRQTERYAHLVPNATHHAAVAGLDLALVDSASPQKALNDASGIDRELKRGH